MYKILLCLTVIAFCGCQMVGVDNEAAITSTSEFHNGFDSITSSEIAQLSEDAQLNDGGQNNSNCLSLQHKGKYFIETSLQPNTTYKFSFWQKEKGAVLEVKFLEDTDIKLIERTAYHTKNGWHKIELLVNTYFLTQQTPIEVVVKNTAQKPVLIDNFEITALNGITPDFNLNLEAKNLQKVIELRNKAFHSPYIKASAKKNVKAQLNNNDVKIKLKGDWKDHINTGVWSYKTTGSKEVLNGTPQVTFQNIKARNMLKEWLFLKLCDDANIVTPFYEVTTLAINKSAAYLCVAEESFAKGFIKRKTGYDAPVLRLYEDFLFPHWVKGWSGKNFEIPELENSFIYVYDKKKYLDKKHAKQFYNDASSLKAFITKDSVTHLIDQEKWATLFAIQSLTKSYHSLTWHNTRFFVNKKGLIEPIAYDGSSNTGETENWYGGGIYGDLEKYFTAPSVAISFTNKLFLDTVFLQLYKEKLALYSQELTIKNFVKKHAEEYQKISSKVKAFYEYDLPLQYLEECRLKLASSNQNFTNERFIGRKNLFFRPLSNGKAPSDKFYTSVLVRGYVKDGQIRFINGTNQAVAIETADSVVVKINKHSDASIPASSAEFFVEVDGEKIKIEVYPWVPLS